MHSQAGATIHGDGSIKPPFDGLLLHLVAQISSLPPGTIHRVVIPTILSPVAYPSVASDPRHVLQFLHAIRALLRRFPNQLTVMTSLPLSLYPRASGLTRWVEVLSDGVLELAPFPSHANLALATSVPSSTMLQEEPPQGILKVYELPILHEKGGGEHQSGHTDDLAFTLSRRKGLTIKPFSLPPLDSDDSPDSHQHESGHSHGKSTKVDIEF